MTKRSNEKIVEYNQLLITRALHQNHVREHQSKSKQKPAQKHTREDWELIPGRAIWRIFKEVHNDSDAQPRLRTTGKSENEGHSLFALPNMLSLLRYVWNLWHWILNFLGLEILVKVVFYCFSTPRLLRLAE